MYLKSKILYKKKHFKCYQINKNNYNKFKLNDFNLIKILILKIQI